MSWFDPRTWFKRSTYSDPIGFSELIARMGQAVASGVDVSERTALQLTTVYACINVIATDAASLPLRVYRRNGKSRELMVGHPVDQMMTRTPDGHTTPMRFRQAMLSHVLGWGNAYAHIQRSQGRPMALVLLDPSKIRAIETESGRLYYEGQDKTIYRPADILHVAGLGFDGLCGYSPIRMAREAIGLGLAAEKFGASLFGNSAMPKGFIKVPQKLDKAAADRLITAWNSMHQGAANAHKTAVLEQGAEWHATSINPEDAQFLATRQFQVVELCRMYRLPPHKVGDYSQSHLANVEASNIDYLQTGLMPWLEAIEQEFNRKLFMADEQDLYLEHNMTAFLRGDMKSRAEFYKAMRDLGAINPNEIRERENLDPIKNGDIYLVPLNMTSLANAGVPPVEAPQTTQPRELPWPTNGATHH